MEDTPEQLSLFGSETREANSSNNTGVTHQSAVPSQLKNKKWWLGVIIYTLFVLSGQSGATLLGRLYYNKGGKSIWLATLVGTIGFPILIPFSLYFSPPKDPSNSNTPNNTPSALSLTTVYISLGLLQAAYNTLYSIGLLYIPVSTFCLIGATQLAFNAFFSFFLNSQKLTPLIVNSLFLLTISATLVILQDNSENPRGVSKGKHAIGVLCTVLGSALYSLVLSLIQLSFQKVLKRETFTTVLNMIIYTSLVATCVTIVALFASGEWNGLKGEMEKFELGKVSYVTILVLITVGWELFSIGAVGLVFEVSSLFSNVISTVALPIVPILAAIFFHDKMDGLKVIAIVLAVWGFASYVYQHYLDNSKSNTDEGNVNEVSGTSPTERC